MNLFDHADHARAVEAIRDLLEHPRHSLPPPARRWLKATLREELERPGSTFESTAP